MYPHQENFNTYNRGSRQIDFALAPPEIADLVTNFVYEPFFYRLKGDHRGFYFDIPEALLFGNAKPSVYDVNGRKLNSKDIKNVRKYIEAVHDHLISQNVFARVWRLASSSNPDYVEIEKLDQIMTKAYKIGESKCTRKSSSYVSSNP